ncbi:hypothetical protein ASPZODRAFT_160137 [Penicilliopsis zonata CBS 506.65]|uniref:Carboxylic ester hydrolase n=1 Tax=Penicilliopsis zonata CBS 506.65 TaxID=1073090 RepID=A0A1L9SDP7_9EURO|nr:hypothetical protein ASPZODRAFT_160137 [Penicilliopsis zonata CBS 506.65]OJJ45207.1 hypothetical protein ASPZODRAFT_160137 [Penicilliopsis zonata CBS 506.65]
MSYSVRVAGALAALAGTARAVSSLSEACTVAKVQAALPADGTFNGLSLSADSVTANTVYNVSYTGQTFFPDTTINYCNVTFTYSHDGADDEVQLEYWLPAPADFANRFLTTGGGAYDINSQGSSNPGGVMYGAVAGMTDGGFGSFDTALDSIFLLGNSSTNWPAVYMFGYQALRELTLIGQNFTANFYNTSDHIYTYYQGCSEGGREGWSQVQRAGDLYDGVIAGAPALRYGQQQANHLFAAVAEVVEGYYPPPCEFDKLVNLTIAACDPLDGKTDGVVSRSDLCQLHYNLSSAIGEPYYCAESTTMDISGAGGDGGMITLPAQNGTVSAEGVALAKTLLAGLHDSNGKKAYIYYQMGAEYGDATTTWDNTTESWAVDLTSNSAEWITLFLELKNTTDLSLDGVTYDTVKQWMIHGMEQYYDSLQTTLADLTPFYENGAKIIHFHGEQDPSIPTGSSIHWYESVRSVMFPDMQYNASVAAMNDWYRLYTVPGAAHCATNDLQPNGPFPQTNMQVMIDWVENGIEPVTLNATFLTGDYLGENTQLCSWPLRPYWNDNTSLIPDCVYDQASIDTFMYKFDAYKLPLY